MYISNFGEHERKQSAVKMALEKSLMDEIEKPAEHISVEKLKKILDELDDEELTEEQREMLDEVGRILMEITQSEGGCEENEAESKT